MLLLLLLLWPAITTQPSPAADCLCSAAN